MNSLRVLCIVIVAILAYGCSDTQTPTVDLPARTDAIVLMADMETPEADAFSSDVGVCTRSGSASNFGNWFSCMEGDVEAEVIVDEAVFVCRLRKDPLLLLR